jgi:RNA recognition motif. (a.k.a. RRM, RBD, or RNP domain)
MVTDVYNTGKGYAFVTFDREEDSKMAIQVCMLFLTLEQCL